MSFCSSPERKTIFLPASGFGALVGPFPGGLRAGVFGDRGLGVGNDVGEGRRSRQESATAKTAPHAIERLARWLLHVLSSLSRVQGLRCSSLTGECCAAARRTISLGGRTMLSGAPSGDLTRRSRRRAASSPIWRAPMSTVVSAGRCMAPSGMLSKPTTATSRPGGSPRSTRPTMNAERAEVVVAEDRGRLVGAPRNSRPTALRPLRGSAGSRRSGRSAIRTAPASRDRPAPGRAPATRDARRRRRRSVVPEADQVLGGQRHAEPEVGADMIRALASDSPQHLHDGQALPAQPLDDSASGALGGREQDAVDPVLAHARDEAALARRRLRGVGEKRHPARPVERLVDSGRQFGVERIGDLADDQADRVRQPRPQIGRGAVVDIAERVDRGSNARPRRRRRPAGCCAGRATPSPATLRHAGRCLSRSGAIAPSQDVLDRSKLFIPQTWEGVNPSELAETACRPFARRRTPEACEQSAIRQNRRRHCERSVAIQSRRRIPASAWTRHAAVARQ